MSDLITNLRNAADEMEEAKSRISWETKSGVDLIALMRFAANDIERLRAIAGAVTAGESVATIKEMLRTPEGIAKLKDTARG